VKTTRSVFAGSAAMAGAENNPSANKVTAHARRIAPEPLCRRVNWRIE
jgi:hypothetical protein